MQFGSHDILETYMQLAWIKGPWAMVTPVKAIRAWVGLLKHFPNLFRWVVGSGAEPVFKWPSLASFCLFRSFQTQILQKNCRRQRDLNSDRWSRKHPRWPLRLFIHERFICFGDPNKRIPNWYNLVKTKYVQFWTRNDASKSINDLFDTLISNDAGFIKVA